MCNKKRPLVILTGPTAVGKTKTSIALAKKIDGEIISADSMQVYRGMDIGSAKITLEEMEGVPHYLIDILEPTESFNVMLFQQKAKEAMEKIYQKGKIPILVGGTGFYIQAVLYDIDFTEENNDSMYRKKLEAEGLELGPGYLHDKLKEVDPEAAEAIPANNMKRVIRALEYYSLTGQKISEHNKEQRQKESPYAFSYFVLNDNREEVYNRIEQRVDRMVEDGLVEEVKKLKNMGLTKSDVSMQGLGYKEILAYLDGEYSFEEAIRVLKRDTRHFAKRQLTWFRREQDVTFVDMAYYREHCDELYDFLEKEMRNRGVL